LDHPRSVVLILANHTDDELRFVADHHAHGGYKATPQSKLPPQEVLTFGSQDTGFMTGTEGYAVWQIGDKKADTYLQMHWGNPFLGATTGAHGRTPCV
jgi:hypothetical protein